jgi:hypothetical protein
MNQPRPHPHSDATYEVVPLVDGGFSVEVSIPGSEATTVLGFATDEAANAWISAHRQRVKARPFNRRNIRKVVTRAE